MGKVKDNFFTDTEAEAEVDAIINEGPYGDGVQLGEKPLIYSRMAAILKDSQHIGKDQRNQQQKFNYRGIDDVYNGLHGIFAKHGVFNTSKVLEKSREERTSKHGGILAFTTLRMEYTFWAEDGSSVSTIVEGEGMDSGDKSSNKAMAVAHKYALLQVFLIPTDEVKDPDDESHEVVDIAAHINACEDIRSLQQMWGKLTKQQHLQFAGVKDQRKNEILAIQAEKDEAKL